jgi:HEAT repeat protein
MSRAALSVLCLCLPLTLHADDAPANKKPDVRLVVPEETRPEIKAIIKANASALASKRASERMKAAEVLGELAEEGRPVRRLLCRAMLDPVPGVRVAAADALRNIDPKIQKLAVSFVSDPPRLTNLLARIQAMEDEARLLTPLVAYSARQHASGAVSDSKGTLSQELAVLSHIARKDHAVCKQITSALGSKDRWVRKSAMVALTRMKHGKQAVLRIMRLLSVDTPDNRITAIEVLTALADRTTEETVLAAAFKQRYHPSEAVRQAVDKAVRELKSRAAKEAD